MESNPEDILLLLFVVALIVATICFCCWALAGGKDPPEKPLQFRADDKKSQARCENYEEASINIVIPKVPINSKLNKFILNEVFPKELYQQAKTDNGQFAVLFVGDKNDTEYKLKLGGSCTKFTDSSQVSYPDDKNLGNYIVARPDAKDEHAEKFLLDRFEALKNTYFGENNYRQPSFILIYSWCMPCGECTSAIINLKNIVSEVTVVYKTDYDLKQDSRNKKRLRDTEGINLYQDGKYHPRTAVTTTSASHS